MSDLDDVSDVDDVSDLDDVSDDVSDDVDAGRGRLESIWSGGVMI